jgi:riboflavin synthase
VFTGIIEHIALVTAAEHRHDGSVLTVDLGPLAEGTKLGDSIATDGICLTVTRLDGVLARYDVSAETRRKTTLPGWKPGKRVNCERALRLGDRLGGHMVGGHVDGIGRLLERRREGDGERLTFVLPDGGAVLVVEKGSVSIDGISLTTWDCRGARFSVAVVPHTIRNTTLADLRPGQTVNLEQDVVGRWVERLARPG